MSKRYPGYSRAGLALRHGAVRGAKEWRAVPWDVWEAYERLVGFFTWKAARPSPAVAAQFLAQFEAGDWRGTALDKARALADRVLAAGLATELTAPRPGAAEAGQAARQRGRTLEMAASRAARGSAVSLRTKAAKGSFGNSLGALWCGRCGADTAHRGYTCLACGVTDAPRIRTSAKLPRGQARRYRAAMATASADRRAALARRAEESRRKWEGAT